MFSRNNFYLINITHKALITANYLAKIRNPYEFQRNAYLYLYDKLTTMQEILQLPSFKLSKDNTTISILLEILIFDDLTKYLQQKYFQNQSPTLILRQFMIEQSCCYHLVISSYNKGFYIQKNNIDIDIKCYENKIVENIDEINNLNLLVDGRQFDNFKTVIHIQTFILKNNNSLFLVVARYANSNMLVLNSAFQNTAYCCYVSDLLPHKHFKEKYF